MSTNNFDAWASSEIKKGLVDIKFAVAAGKGIAIESVQEELLASEIMINASSFRAKPRATSEIPSDIKSIINAVTV